MTKSGRVHRHVDRGATEQSRREARAAEDSASRAGARGTDWLPLRDVSRFLLRAGWSVVAFVSSGARNCLETVLGWPSLVQTMAPVAQVLRNVRRDNKQFQHLARLCGPAPSRKPPSEKSIERVRHSVAGALDVKAKLADVHHQSSPWRWGLVQGVQRRCKDPDTSIVEWLRKGAPVGIAAPVVPGGLLPRISEQATLSPEDLFDMAVYDANHSSFNLEHDGHKPARDELQGLVDQGFARLCRDRQHAEELLGSQVVVSPLGDVVKQRPDGTLKHRLIQDFKASSVNAASVVEERQVLPRFADHGYDLAKASEAGRSVGVLILDFKQAFMTIPLAACEMPFNASVVPEGLRRTRRATYVGEPEEGTILLWNVLGFGGHSNPLVYSRVACFAARSAQALLASPVDQSGMAQGRLQLYVDDPALVLEGNLEQQHEALDVFVLWLLVLGIPLSWSKGSFSQASERHTWIGVDFHVPSPGLAVLTVPRAFVDALLTLVRRFADRQRRVASLREAEELCGKGGRLAQVIPDARPFVAGLYAALTASKRALAAGAREAPPSKVATRRFRSSAAWLSTLLEGAQDAKFPLEHRLWSTSPSFDPLVRRIEFDASTTGGAAILFEDNDATEFWLCEWSVADGKPAGAVTNLSDHQTFWELATSFP